MHEQEIMSARSNCWSVAVAIVTLAAGLHSHTACLPFVARLPLAYVKGIFLFGVLICTLGIRTPLSLPSALLGRIATRGESTRDGEVAMAVFASYAIGQFIPLLY